MTLDDVVNAVKSLQDVLIFVAMAGIFFHGFGVGRSLARKL